MSESPEFDPVGTVRVFPRWQDEHHERQLAIRWSSPMDRDEQYPWLILDSEGPQRLGNDNVEGCERLPLADVARELGHSAPDPSSPWPIPLPPEPPRDRVVEAVDQDGTVVAGWRYFKAWGTWRRDGKVWGNCWEEIVRTAMRSRWTLRHVADKES